MGKSAIRRIREPWVFLAITERDEPELESLWRLFMMGTRFLGNEQLILDHNRSQKINCTGMARRLSLESVF